MIAFLQQYSPIVQALFGTLFTWGMTAIGAGMIFFTKQVSRKLLDGMLGFASGVMIAASYWSLLAPAIEMSEGLKVPSWVPATVGFLIGGGFLFAVDKLLPHLHQSLDDSYQEGLKSSWQRSVLLVTAITLHNIPEALRWGSPLGLPRLELGMPAWDQPSHWRSALAFRISPRGWRFQHLYGGKAGSWGRLLCSVKLPGWWSRWRL